MERLLKGTTAYKILTGDRQAGRLSHAYMLDFPDRKNMNAALKIFALGFSAPKTAAHFITEF